MKIFCSVEILYHWKLVNYIIFGKTNPDLYEMAIGFDYVAILVIDFSPNSL